MTAITVVPSTSETCLFCKVFNTIDTQSTDFAKTFFDTVQPDLATLMQGVIGAYFAWLILDYVAFNRTTVSKFVGEIIAVMIASSLLATNTKWWQITKWFYDVSIYCGMTLFNVGAKTETSGTASFFSVMENAYWNKVVLNGLDKVRTISIFHLPDALIGILYVVLALFLFWKLAGTVFMAYLQFIGISFLAPFICMFVAFPMLRNTWVSTLKMLITAGMQIILSCGFAGLCLKILETFQAPQVLSVDVNTPSTITVFITLLILLKGYDKIVSVANELMGTVQKNTGNAFSQAASGAMGALTSLATSAAPLGAKLLSKVIK